MEVCSETYIKDHLGNIRVAFGNEGNESQFGIRQVNAYYPFGMNINSLTANKASSYSKNEYLYNGKMFQDELGLDWLDYGARFYDAVIGRWVCIDNLSEKYVNLAPYQYVENNPLKFVDPDGNGGIITTNGKQATMTINIVLYPGQGLNKADVDNYMQSSFSDYQSGKAYSLNVQNASGLTFTNPNKGTPEDLKVVFNVIVMDYESANNLYMNTKDASQNFFMVGTDVGTEAGKNTNNEDDNPNQPMVNTGVISTSAFGDGNRTTGILAEEGWHTTNAMYGNTYGDHNLNPDQNKEGGDNSVCASHVNQRTSTTVNQRDISAVMKGQLRTKNGELKGWKFINNRAVNGDRSNEKILKFE